MSKRQIRIIREDIPSNASALIGQRVSFVLIDKTVFLVDVIKFENDIFAVLDVGRRKHSIPLASIDEIVKDVMDTNAETPPH